MRSLDYPELTQAKLPVSLINVTLTLLCEHSYTVLAQGMVYCICKPLRTSRGSYQDLLDNILEQDVALVIVCGSMLLSSLKQIAPE